MGNSQKKSTLIDTGIPVKPPSQFLTKDEFFDTWYIWKKNFLTFKSSFYENNYDKKQWGNRLLNIMGPVGYDIYNTFKFNSPNEKDNVDILLQKFDEYFVFLERRKLPKETVYGYINDLVTTIKEKNIENGEELIKKRILEEIDKNQFNNCIYCFIPSFILSDDFNNLTLKEIGFIWTKYISAQSCTRCGKLHASDKCPSLGKRCLKCNGWNHFPKRCPNIFIADCNYCGGAHKRKLCPAFNEICTKCKHLNHFSWKCQQQQILRCRFCGLTHGASRALCPAKSALCANCKTRGHFTTKCNGKPHSCPKN